MAFRFEVPAQRVFSGPYACEETARAPGVQWTAMHSDI